MDEEERTQYLRIEALGQTNQIHDAESRVNAAKRFEKYILSGE